MKQQGINPMRYMVLIYENEASYAALSDEERAANQRSHDNFHSELAKAGIKMSAEALSSTDTAKTIRVRDGKTTTTDGPFAETKEQIGGYYILDCKDFDEVSAWAAKLPEATRGSIEIRPLQVFN